MKINFLFPLPQLLVAAVLVAAAGMAQARNDKLLLPIDAAVRSKGTQALLSQDIALRFGKASAVGAEIISSNVDVHAVADPYSFNNGNNNGNNYGNSRRDRRSDDQVCLDAFRKALVELQQRARSNGGGAVVGIVSDYNKMEFDSVEVYECHVGMTRAVVDLRGQVARGAMPQAARTAPAAPALAAAVPAPQSAVALAPAAPAAVAAAAQPLLIASGFANINDVDAIPYLSDKGREDYRQWVARPTPKAFAIAPTGHWFGAWSLKPMDPTHPADPAERALLVCSQRAQMPCKLYAVNGSVVWTK